MTPTSSTSPTVPQGAEIDALIEQCRGMTMYGDVLEPEAQLWDKVADMLARLRPAEPSAEPVEYRMRLGREDTWLHSNAPGWGHNVARYQIGGWRRRNMDELTYTAEDFWRLRRHFEAFAGLDENTPIAPTAYAKAAAALRIAERVLTPHLIETALHCVETPSFRAGDAIRAALLKGSDHDR